MIINHTSPAEIDDNGDDVHIAKQYSHLSKKYPAVHQMVMSVLYIFHGLKVEPGFSAMGDLINKKANWMPGRTYSTIIVLCAGSMPKFSLSLKDPAP